MIQDNNEIGTRELRKMYHEFLSPLYLLMQLSRVAYGKYMQNKIYLHALAIRSSNQKIYDWVMAHLSLVPDSIQEDILQILNHYDIWMAQFSEFERDKQPRLEDPFIFYHIDNQSAFPKAAEQKIFDYYFQIKQVTTI